MEKKKNKLALTLPQMNTWACWFLLPSLSFLNFNINGLNTRFLPVK